MRSWKWRKGGRRSTRSDQQLACVMEAVSASLSLAGMDDHQSHTYLAPIQHSDPHFFQKWAPNCEWEWQYTWWSVWKPCFSSLCLATCSPAASSSSHLMFHHLASTSWSIQLTASCSPASPTFQEFHTAGLCWSDLYYWSARVSLKFSIPSSHELLPANPSP